MRARWREWWQGGKYATQAEGLDFWRRYFVHVSKSAFLTGRAPATSGRAPFVADLEWLVHPEHYLRVIEGRFHEETAA